MSSTSKQYHFSQRQYWISFKLLENTTIWHGLLSNDTLHDVVVDGLLNRYSCDAMVILISTVCIVTNIQVTFSYCSQHYFYQIVVLGCFELRSTILLLVLCSSRYILQSLQHSPATEHSVIKVEKVLYIFTGPVRKRCSCVQIEILNTYM